MSSNLDFDVFLAHGSQDREVAWDLALRLKRDGLHVWFEDWEGSPEKAGASLEEGLERSRTLILLMSGSVRESEWSALERRILPFRDPGDSGRRFVPLRLDESELRPALQAFTHLEWRLRSKDEYAQLLGACRLPRRRPAAKRGVEARRLVFSIYGDPPLAVAVTPDGRRMLSAVR